MVTKIKIITLCSQFKNQLEPLEKNSSLPTRACSKFCSAAAPGVHTNLWNGPLTRCLLPKWEVMNKKKSWCPTSSRSQKRPLRKLYGWPKRVVLQEAKEKDYGSERSVNERTEFFLFNWINQNNGCWTTKLQVRRISGTVWLSFVSLTGKWHIWWIGIWCGEAELTIEEFSINNSASPHDSDENLQALCLMFKHGQNETVQAEEKMFKCLDWLKRMNI